MQGLEGNIIKYSIYKIFTKRVYLPLIAVFLIDHGGVTLQELAVMASVTAVVQFVMEIPSGYFADRIGHKEALVFGCFISALSILPYIFFPGFIGGLIASAGFFGGAAFASGTAQAFIHETLLSLGRDEEYSEVMGKAQAFGLIGNVFLISVIPLTYTIHPRLPFIIGFLCLLAAFFIVLSLTKPDARILVEEEGYRRGTLEKFKDIMRRTPVLKLFLVFLIFGIVSSGFDHGVMFREVMFRDIGIPIEFFGFLLSIGSLLAAIGARYIHHLKKLSPSQFYLFDGAYLVTICLLVGITRNPLVLALIFALFPAYDRTRNIIFESQVFEEFRFSKYKATIISVMNFFALLNGVWIPLILASLVDAYGLSSGYFYFGTLMGVLLFPILFFQWFVSRRSLEVEKIS